MNESKHARGGRRGWVLWAALGASLLVGGGLGAGIASAANSSASTPAASTTPSGASSGQVSVCNVTAVANQVTPSVVTISARGAEGGGTGSGEVIKSGGYILTNNHVIAIAANGGSVEVQFADGQTAPATTSGGIRRPTSPCSRSTPRPI